MVGQSEKYSLDDVDRRILRALQDDASRPVNEIAAEVGLSQTPCWRRIKRMREAGIIERTVAIVDPEALGLPFQSYAFVKLALPSTANMERFDTLVQRWPEVVTCERITGAVDYLLKILAADIKDYDDFLRHRLLATDLVSDVQSRIVVSSVKRSTAIPVTLGHVAKA